MAIVRLTVVNSENDKEDVWVNSNIISYITKIEKDDPLHKQGARAMVSLKQIVFQSDMLAVTQDPDNIARSI